MSGDGNGRFSASIARDAESTAAISWKRRRKHAISERDVALFE
jgi:hypothetical protein